MLMYETEILSRKVHSTNFTKNEFLEEKYCKNKCAVNKAQAIYCSFKIQ